MKKMMALVLAVVMMLSVTACALAGGNDTAGGFDADSATAVLEAVWNNYPEDQKFPVMGGDYDHLTDGVPGAFDYTNAEYMDSLKEENSEMYEKQFSRYIKAGITGAMFEEIYANAHKAIRADPTPAKKSDFDYAAAFKQFAHAKKLTLEQRKERVAAKKAAMAEEE